MKTIIMWNLLKLSLLVCFITYAVSGKSQTFVRPKAPPTDSTKCVGTGKTYEGHNVYVSKKGAYFIVKISKTTGSQYKEYLRKEDK